MSYQVLARKWRPRTFAEMVGQEHVVRALGNALDSGRLHHAYLFSGTRGVGKTTLARIFAKSLNCERGVSSSPCGQCGSCREVDEGRFADLLEVDAASRTKVEQTRELLDNVIYAPARGRYKVYLIDEVHMFSGHSFNALLKTLEEPPPHVKFLLATTDPQKVPVTVLSRCLQFNLKRLPPEQIAVQLQTILEAETLDYEKPALQRIARAADGSMRDALSLLDQSIVHGGGAVQDAQVVAMLGGIATERAYDLIADLAARNASSVMARVASLAEDGADLGLALQELLRALHQVAVAQQAPAALDSGDPIAVRAIDLARRLAPEDIQLFYQIGLLGQRDLPWAPDPRSGFEMALLRMLAFFPETAAAETARAEAAPLSEAARVSEQGASSGRPPSALPSAGEKRSGMASEASAVDVLPGLESPAGWREFLITLKLGGIATQLASNCEFLSWDGSRLRLRLDPKSAQLRVANAEQRLRDALRERFGESMQLSIEVAAPEKETPAQQQKRLAGERQQQAEESLAADPFVEAMADKLGARLIPGSVEPSDE